MMAIRLLCVTAVLLMAALWWRWEKNPLQWSPPAAIMPDATAFEVKKSQKYVVPQGVASYLSVLDRPIFSSDRRPPAAIEEKPQVAEVDVFSNLQLLGLLTGPEYTGAVVRENGKVRRIKVSDDLGGWQLESVLDRDAKFVRNGDVRVLKLVPLKVAPANTKTADQITGSEAKPQALATPVTSVDLVAQENQKREEAKRENIRKRNALRASAGLPPVFD